MLGMYIILQLPQGFPGGLTVKNPPVMQESQEAQVLSLGWEGPWRRHGNPLQYSFLENPHGKGSLAGYSPWGHKESNTAEVTEHPRRVTTYWDVMMKRNLWILLKMES